jgi:hypothetical protein
MVTKFIPLSDSELQSGIKSQNDTLAVLRDDYNKAWEKELETTKGYSDWHFLVATAITRIGVVLVLIFLVQILIRLYRYNVQLTTHYVSLLDFVYAWDGNPGTADEFMRIFSPPPVEFGKEPRSAFEEMASILAREIGKRLDRGAGAQKSERGAGEE